MNILVVEPHPDDAFLSLGWHLEKTWKEAPKRILTVFHNEKRGKEAEAYADKIGAEWYGLGLEESEMTGGSRPRIIPELREELERVSQDFDKIVAPLGLQHPDHRSVAYSCRGWATHSYLDSPYLSKQKMAEELARGTKGHGISSIVFPPKRKWRLKEIFKSQAKFFYYNASLVDSKIPEIVLESLRKKSPD